MNREKGGSESLFVKNHGGGGGEKGRKKEDETAGKAPGRKIVLAKEG